MNLLHAGQLAITSGLVKTLLESQFPEYSRLPLREFDSTGTVNAVFRLGNEYYVRLPLVKQYAESLLTEYRVLPYLAEKLSLPIPQPVQLGLPSILYPFHWAIYTWIDGDTYDADSITAYQEIVPELAGFIRGLRAVPVLENAPKAGRAPLSALNTMTIDALNASENEIDCVKAVKIWERLADAPVWDTKPVWIHADLLKANILIKNNHIAAILDFGSAGIGDPAFDIIPAWAVFDSESRDAFRKLLNPDDALWHRACGYALHQAALGIPYYRKSNPRFVKQSLYTINQIMSDSL